MSFLISTRGLRKGFKHLGDSSSSKEEDAEQGEEDAPRVYGMDNCCQGCNNNAEGCQRIPRIRAVTKA